jgi:glycolate oxidase FAD binding subunit
VEELVRLEGEEVLVLLRRLERPAVHDRGVAPAVLEAARGARGSVVARAAIGLSWVTLEGDALAGRVEAVRAALAPRACTLQDAPDDVRAACPTWAEPDPGALAVMRRVKERFDPARIFSPGSFVGGI